MANLPVPIPRTFTVGEVEFGAYLNALRDALLFLLNPPEAVIYQTTVQTLTSGTPAMIQFDSFIVDTYGGHSNSTNNTRYTAQVAGWYWIGGTVAFNNVAGGNRNAQIYKNGVLVPQFGFAGPAGSANIFTTINCFALVSLAAGDYVEIQAFQDQGGNVATHTLASSLVVDWRHA